MQVITAKRRKSQTVSREYVHARAGTWSFITALQVVVIFLSIAVSIVLPLHFGNETDKMASQARETREGIVQMRTRIDSLTREIAYLETVVGSELDN